MQVNRQFIVGDNIFIPHPTQKYDIHKYNSVDGNVEVAIVQYSDGTVLVQIGERGRQPYTWINRNVEIDEKTNTARIIKPDNPS